MEPVIEARWVAEVGRGSIREVVRPHGMDLWRKIGSEGHQFLECLQWKLRWGNNICFWDDKWTGRGSLRNHFPKIYAIAQRKNMVEEVIRGEDTNSMQNLNLFRNLNDQEIEEFEALLLLMSTVQLSEDIRIRWHGNRKRTRCSPSILSTLTCSKESGIGPVSVSTNMESEGNTEN